MTFGTFGHVMCVSRWGNGWNYHSSGMIEKSCEKNKTVGTYLRIIIERIIIIDTLL